MFDGGTCQGQKCGAQWRTPIIQALRSLRKTRNYSGHSISQRAEKEWGEGGTEGERERIRINETEAKRGGILLKS